MGSKSSPIVVSKIVDTDAVISLVIRFTSIEFIHIMIWAYTDPCDCKSYHTQYFGSS